MKNVLMAKEKERMPKKMAFIVIITIIVMPYYLVLDLVKLSSIKFILAIKPYLE